MRPARVHRVEVRRRVLVGLAARQEDDARHRRRHVLHVALERPLGDLFVAGAARGLVPGEDHVRLQQRPEDVDALVEQLGVDRVEDAARHVVAALDRVCAVLQDLRLDDRHDAGLLAERCVARERVCVRPDAVVARELVRDRVRRAPLREARAETAVFLEPLPEPVEAFRDRLALRVGERLRALVHLDARDDAFRREQLRKRRTVRIALPDCLVVEDDAADVVLDARRREQQVAVRAAVLLGRLEADRVEALLDRAGALVRGEDALAVGDERPRGVMQLVGHVAFSCGRFAPEITAGG